jgi:hypothetical protein
MDLPELFKSCRFIEESVADYGADKAFFISEGIPDEIFFHRITNLIQV